MYQLEQTIYFYLTLVIPIVLIGFLILNRWKITVQKEYVSKKLLKILSPNISTFKPKLKLIFLLLFFLFISISLVNPKIGTQLKTVKRE